MTELHFGIHMVELIRNEEQVALKSAASSAIPSPVNFNLCGLQRVPRCLRGSVSPSPQWDVSPYPRALL